MTYDSIPRGVWDSFFNWITNPFDHAHIDATATILVGISAYVLYLMKSRANKRDKAKIILQEIRFIDQLAVTTNNTHGFDLYQRLLPSETWNSNKHLFVGDFTESQLDEISIYYSKAKDIDELMSAISSQINDSHLTVKVFAKFYNPERNTLLKSDGTNFNTHKRILDLRNSMLQRRIMNTPISQKFESLTLTFWQKISRSRKKS